MQAGPVTAFLDGVLRAALVGSVALLAGLLVADIVAHAGAPLWVTAALGFWTMLCIFAVLRPPAGQAR
jgi:hypothetical protein